MKSKDDQVTVKFQAKVGGALSVVEEDDKNGCYIKQPFIQSGW